MKIKKRKLSFLLAFCLTVTIFSQALSYADFSFVSKALFANDIHEDILGIEENSDQVYDYPDENIKEGPCGTNAYWSFDEESGTLTVSGSGEMEPFPELAYPHWYFLRDKIKTIEITENVTTVSENAFAYCENLKTVILSENVSRIYWRAFFKCSSFEEFIVSENNSAFAAENGVLFSKDKKTIICAPAGISGKYTIPHGVNLIDYNAFESCEKLVEIILPSTVSRISNNAFSLCKKLEAITISENVTKIGYMAFADCTSLKKVVFLNGDVKIQQCAFVNCTSLAEIILPEGITSLINDAFINCPALEKVYIPDSLEQFNVKAFKECGDFTVQISETHPTLYYFEGFLCKKGTASIISPLGELSETVAIPDGITDISDYAFSNKKSIKTIILPKSLKTISKDAFYNCESLSDIQFEEGLEEIKSYAFTKCSSLEKISFPKSLKTLGESAFKECSNLTEVIFQEGILIIDTDAFKNCSRLNAINFPQTLKIIGSSAFYGCSALDEVTIFSSVESIGSRSFGYELCGCGLEGQYSITFNVEKGSVAEKYALENGFLTDRIKYLDVTALPNHKYYLSKETHIAPNLPLQEKLIDFISYFDSMDIYIQVISSDRYISTGDTIIYNEEKYDVLIIGDIDGDNTISSTDYLRIKSYFLGELQLEGVYFLAADMNEDGDISSTDYLLLKNMLLNK